MIDWIRDRLGLRRREEQRAETHVEVEKAERRQQQQFDAWADTLKEVSRVQRITMKR